jgi:uncharacterized protein
MPYGINDTSYSQLLSLFEQNKKVESAILFGSRVKGNFRPGSDVDIVLKGEGLTLKDIIEIQNKLDDFDQPYIFDLILYHYITEPALISHIHRVGVEIFNSRVVSEKKEN